MKKESDDKDNAVVDLKTMMFDQMKRLSDPNVDLDKEIKRSQALSAAGTVIINAAKVQIDAARVDHLIKNGKPKQKLLGNGK